MSRSKKKGNCGRHCMVCHGPKVVYGESQERAACLIQLRRLKREKPEDDSGPKQAITRKRG